MKNLTLILVLSFSLSSFFSQNAYGSLKDLDKWFQAGQFGNIVDYYRKVLDSTCKDDTKDKAVAWLDNHFHPALEYIRLRIFFQSNTVYQPSSCAREYIPNQRDHQYYATLLVRALILWMRDVMFRDCFSSQKTNMYGYTTLKAKAKLWMQYCRHVNWQQAIQDGIKESFQYKITQKFYSPFWIGCLQKKSYIGGYYKTQAIEFGVCHQNLWKKCFGSDNKEYSEMLLHDIHATICEALDSCTSPQNLLARLAVQKITQECWKLNKVQYLECMQEQKRKEAAEFANDLMKDVSEESSQNQIIVANTSDVVEVMQQISQKNRLGQNSGPETFEREVQTMIEEFEGLDIKIQHKNTQTDPMLSEDEQRLLEIYKQWGSNFLETAKKYDLIQTRNQRRIKANYNGGNLDSSFM